MSNPTEEQLFKVKESLEKDGRLGRFKAQLCSSVMSILHTRQPTKEDFGEIPEETKIINELLREYLLWNGYVYSENFLSVESGADKDKQPKEKVAAKLGIIDVPRKSEIPLLYYIVSAFQNHDE
ncbi:lisH domain-containing protein FOPNL-like isoform X2 [Photinus pyralis]|uniref:lisH domain-containing protein FOPNL-like isoform X2 n=1 Tax=Photinus pyralis TaxID=7054 RepID=UPI001267595F|nr:lisH domain-containing protein FOPNL-like isoform X2 [Photinus pyralis]